MCDHVYDIGSRERTRLSRGTSKIVVGPSGLCSSPCWQVKALREEGVASLSGTGGLDDAGQPVICSVDVGVDIDVFVSVYKCIHKYTYK